MKTPNARHAHEIERRTLARMKREDDRPDSSFTQLLRAGADEADRQAINAPAPVQAPAKPIVTTSRRGNEGLARQPMTATARRMIVLGATMRGEDLQESDVETRTRQDLDRAISFTPEVRAIVDRATRKQ